MHEARNIDVSVIIPAYNEADRISGTLDTVCTFLDGQSYEIIVVSDGSTDGTGRLVLEAADRMPVRLIEHEANKGKGAAVQSGMLSAAGSYRLFMDADGSTAIHHWKKMRAALMNADIVVGSRHIAGARIETPQSLIREILGATFRRIVRLMFQIPVEDTQNGFKAFTAAASEALFKDLKTTGWAFDIEVLHRARRLGLRMAEVPVLWHNDRQSKLSLFHAPGMLRDLILIALRH